MREEWKWGKREVGEGWDEWRERKLWVDIIYERRINTRTKIKIKKMKKKEKKHSLSRFKNPCFPTYKLHLVIPLSLCYMVI